MPSTISSQKNNISWEPLPLDFELPDDPVENIEQPLLAAALNDALENAGLIKPSMLIASNFALCAKVDNKHMAKAPDWLYITNVKPVEKGVVRRSFTPHAEGNVPDIVMEFLSETDCGEYSSKTSYPYGKWHYYEQILKVPYYIIFSSASGELEIHHLENERYVRKEVDENGRHWLEPLNLYVGAWYGKRLETTTHWLRFWNKAGEMLQWGNEQVSKVVKELEVEYQRAEVERQRVEALEQELTKLKAQLKIGDSP